MRRGAKGDAMARRAAVVLFRGRHERGGGGGLRCGRSDRGGVRGALVRAWRSYRYPDEFGSPERSSRWLVIALPVVVALCLAAWWDASPALAVVPTTAWCSAS